MAGPAGLCPDRPRRPTRRWRRPATARAAAASEQPGAPAQFQQPQPPLRTRTTGAGADPAGYRRAPAGGAPVAIAPGIPLAKRGSPRPLWPPYAWLAAGVSFLGGRD
jgi:hypothetical protein